jgi:NAD+ kinase
VADHSHIRGCPEGTHPKSNDERAGAALNMSATSIAVLTHRRTEDTHEVLGKLIDMARAAGATLRFDAEETSKHDLRVEPAVEVDAAIGMGAEQLCIVLGGDGTILRALQLYAGTPVPVFAINFGEIGFLATVEPEEIEDGIARALSGRFELLRLPGIVLETPTGEETAINDVAIHRRVGERVAELAYALDSEEVGSVRCDGHNRSREALDVSVDGRPVCELPPDARIRARFVNSVGTIAQLPGSSFYRRLRE